MMKTKEMEMNNTDLLLASKTFPIFVASISVGLLLGIAACIFTVSWHGISFIDILYAGFWGVFALLGAAVLLVFLLLIIYRDIRAMRRVFVFADRIEIRYSFSKTRNSTLRIKDFESYYNSIYTPPLSRRNSYVFHRIFLKKGKQLYFYVDEANCLNYKDMVAILNERFHIPEEKEMIELSDQETQKALSGDFIALE